MKWYRVKKIKSNDYIIQVFSNVKEVIIENKVNYFYNGFNINNLSCLYNSTINTNIINLVIY